MYMQNKHSLTNIENNLGVIKGVNEMGRTNQGYGITDRNYMYKIDKQKDTLYSTRSYSHYLLITYNGV